MMSDVSVSIDKNEAGLGQSNKIEMPSHLKRAGHFVGRFAFFSIIISLVIALGLLVMSTIPLNSLQQAGQSIMLISNWLGIVRLSFVAILGIYWIEINTWISVRKQWSPAYLEKVLKGKWVSITGLLLIELVFIQRIHQPLIDWMFMS